MVLSSPSTSFLTNQKRYLATFSGPELEGRMVVGQILREMMNLASSSCLKGYVRRSKFLDAIGRKLKLIKVNHA